ncbi:MAG: hypothetical protein FJ206_11520 [Gemmatimonadetes bacterium]|nr:hypothetical protein [Gemmatimonadota bacterium]
MIRWIVLCCGLTAGTLAAQSRDEQFYFPGKFNWTFLKTYPEAGRLFNAFDYGHAILYERLLIDPTGSVAALEEKEFNYLVDDLLKRPPRFAIAEEAVMPRYSRLAWRAKAMFERAHILHRQIYDVHADERLGMPERHALVEELTDRYLADRYAFTDKPKAMELMDEQYFSQSFRRAYPKFNGLIWAYHWLQVGLYEALLATDEPTDRRRYITENLDRFWAMVPNAPTGLPSVMPMTSAVAPRFSKEHPRAAVIFDNLHMMHDIISDILHSDKVPRDRKAAVIEEALDEFQNPDRNVIDMEHWWMMAEHMGGVDKMGGVASPSPRP